jgi:hypothetical protein
VEFDAPDGVPVTIVLGLLVPEEASEQQLEELSAIAKLLSRPSLRAAFRPSRLQQRALRGARRPNLPAQMARNGTRGQCDSSS